MIHQANIGNKNIRINEFVSSCSECGAQIEPVDTGLVNWIQNAKYMMATEFEWVLQCPAQMCKRLIIARYSMKSETEGAINGFYSLSEVVPTGLKPVAQHEEIENISPLFVEIFSQAAHAENLGLSQVCGIGYRKALEHLIKDYCVHANPEKSESIQKVQLMNCITSFVKDANVIACAKRATWLGNDEAHYVRKWASQDISDLKVLIELVSNWIVSDVLTKQYIESMPE
ncbi:protein of unknown function [Onishia taeanensis]|uniref:DUF4145 domain-containing protein n=1 Tax=Onishia taeanensis TaxID=284577 RepID=A0A1G7SCR4_9GAMM|nr:DUF4145 domain-containing protein [Halomonas taeanensis]SDG20826.1 protein of unknown function [Halomonas taeanensis]